MIYLLPEVKSGLGEDTFWTWFNREVAESSFNIPASLKPEDVVLQYSTTGRSRFPNQTISLLWELYPEMKKMLGNAPYYDQRIALTMQSASTSARRTVSSKFSIEYYKQYGQIDILPIGVNTDLFKPMDKGYMRDKYGIPQNKQVAFWMGTSHPMKGFNNVVKFHEIYPELEWILVWKSPGEASEQSWAKNYTLVPQLTLAELMNCADFMFCGGLLRPYFMVEWEAFSCGLPPLFYNATLQREFIPDLKNSRQMVFDLGWDRHTAKQTWLKYIGDFINDKT